MDFISETQQMIVPYLNQHGPGEMRLPTPREYHDVQRRSSHSQQAFHLFNERVRKGQQFLNQENKDLLGLWKQKIDVLKKQEIKLYELK